jgi:hypothetical protein
MQSMSYIKVDALRTDLGHRIQNAVVQVLAFVFASAPHAQGKKKLVQLACTSIEY